MQSGGYVTGGANRTQRTPTGPGQTDTMQTPGGPTPGGGGSGGGVDAVGPGVLSMNMGGPLNALSVAPDRKSIVVAGRETIKIVGLDTDGLRHPVTNLRVGKMNLNYTGNDCSWHPTKSWIATAATNGAVAIWDGARIVRLLTDHNRTVNRVTWHSREDALLLSGSQDGTMKLWDTNMREASAQAITFNARSESVRDVAFSPRYPNFFAAAFDNGTVQTWDLRRPDKCLQKIMAHQGLVLAIDWHPVDKDRLASSGRDRMVKIWDLNDLTNPVATIGAISGVSRIRWRPGYNQLATCASLTDTNVQVWDLSRPYIPIASLPMHRDVATGLVWLGSDTVLSCSKDSTVAMQHMRTAYRPYKHIRTGGIAWNPRGELASVNDVINRMAFQEELIPSTASNVPIVYTHPAVTPEGIMNIHSNLSNSKDTNHGFDHFLFQYFAQNYKYQSAPISELCEHNAEVAERVHQFHLAQTWRMISIFCDSAYDPPAAPAIPTLPGTPALNASSSVAPSPSLTSSSTTTTPSLSANSSLPMAPPLSLSNDTSSSAPSKSGGGGMMDPFGSSDRSGSAGGNILSDESFINDMSLCLDLGADTDFMPFVGPEFSAVASPAMSGAADSAYLLSPGTIPSAVTGSRLHSSSGSIVPAVPSLPPVPVLDIWNTDSTLMPLLFYSAEKGDVQTCVMITLVLGRDRLATLYNTYPDLPKKWLGNYIDLLQRFELWNQSTDIARHCGEPAISSLNQQHTSVHTACTSCGKPLFQKGWACERCRKRVGVCAICRLPVKGMYVWCQLCGHGGHLSHVHEWFSNNKACPAGCSHLCTYAAKGARSAVHSH
eukprot:TRINITY_DN5607_c0_g1_i1.p1 TRINITY_DN5607_c0_g1~~TRINITY_DN5607_c0_g1_i1.p1  ORF type:complete len:829 (-),score=148.05 TRINITY_DN5607_c0_g1_i1:31-2517(-)